MTTSTLRPRIFVLVAVGNMTSTVTGIERDVYDTGQNVGADGRLWFTTDGRYIRSWPQEDGLTVYRYCDEQGDTVPGSPLLYKPALHAPVPAVGDVWHP